MKENITRIQKGKPTWEYIMGILVNFLIFIHLRLYAEPFYFSKFQLRVNSRLSLRISKSSAGFPSPSGFRPRPTPSFRRPIKLKLGFIIIVQDVTNLIET